MTEKIGQLEAVVTEYVARRHWLRSPTKWYGGHGPVKSNLKPDGSCFVTIAVSAR